MLLRVWAPLGEVAGYGSLFGLDVFIHGDSLACLALAQPHKALIDGDADEPCRELRVPLELVQLLICLEEGVLRDVFSVFTVLCNVLRNPEYLALILANELFKSSLVALFRASNQRYVGVNFFRSWRLDGRHEQKGA